MKWIIGIPPYELVVIHQKMYPRLQSRFFVLGGNWKIKNERVEQVAILTIRNKDIHIWNGYSFTQSLKDCKWAASSLYFPADSNGNLIYTPD